MTKHDELMQALTEINDRLRRIEDRLTGSSYDCVPDDAMLSYLEDMSAPAYSPSDSPADGLIEGPVTMCFSPADFLSRVNPVDEASSDEDGIPYEIIYDNEDNPSE